MRRIRGLWKLLFGRTTIFVVLILIQIAVLFGGVYLLDEKVIVLNYIVGVIAAVVIIYLLNIQQNSSFKLMWTIIIVATPIIGVPFYFFVKLQPGTRVIGERISQIIIEEERLLLPDKDTVNRLMTDSGQEYGLFKYLYEDGNYPVYDNSGAMYFPSGETKFAELVNQLEKAEDFIFMEYFIIDKGEMWDTVLEILERKVKEGVEVRLMYDGTCVMSLLPRHYPQQLQDKGIACKVFSPMRPFLTTHQNNRDHRKITVIDGKVGFTGGYNIANEYFNLTHPYGYWKDTGIRLEGNAVKSLSAAFLEMWNAIKGNDIDDEHVWALDTKGTCDAIHDAMDNLTGGPVEIVRVALETKPPVTPGAKERGRHIDINLTYQFVRFYDTDGTVLWDSYCVTGGWDPEFQRMHYTPTGEFAIQAKETGRTLVGADTNNDGKPDYESFVYYWMPFLDYDYGLHDATWRYQDAFGGDIYTYYGSHGCVNLPYNKAEELFNLVEVGDPVIIHE